MFRAAQTMDFSNGEFASAWAPTLDRLISQTEAAESSLANHGTATDGRKATGSFYTPADVADHTWDQFFDLHRIDSPRALRAYIERVRLVEPSAGSGMFVLTFLRKALALGFTPADLQDIRFSVIDLNYAALAFLTKSLTEIETELDVDLSGIVLVQRDFLEWAAATKFDRVAFVGNPPFVANPRGSRWRNIFADFVDSMLNYSCEERSIALILPMSISFSRDYEELRKTILVSGMGIRVASYDNIPDCLFKAGKPESSNSNKANSQRCTILMLGGPNPARRQAANLRRWIAAERASVLSSLPPYFDFSNYKFDGQFPRPGCRGVMAYLAGPCGRRTIGDLLDRDAKPSFGIAAVARNFLGIREGAGLDGSSTSLGAKCKSDEMILLQVLASPAFFEYWLTLGDGFHVTRDLMMRFPLSDGILRLCSENQKHAEQTWKSRASYARRKLNNGKIVKSYDFRECFQYINFV